MNVSDRVSRSSELSQSRVQAGRSLDWSPGLGYRPIPNARSQRTLSLSSRKANCGYRSAWNGFRSHDWLRKSIRDVGRRLRLLIFNRFGKVFGELWSLWFA